MDLGLKGKNVLVTGGASGIGLGICRILAQEGMNIAIASRNPSEQAQKEIEQYGVKCIRIFADLSEEENCVSMVNEAIDEFGQLHAYVNNAAWTWHQPITKITDEAFTNTINTNLRAAVFSCREISKHMIKKGEGNIVIIGSTVRFFPAFKEASYRISKMGLKMYMETLAIEMAPHNIRVNMVTPGHFVTRMTSGISDEAVKELQSITPCGRSGDPDEVGFATAFLLSDRVSGFTYGGDLVVDGGLTLHPLLPPDSATIKGFNL